MGSPRRRGLEWRAFVADNARSGGELLFGRITYELMVSYWPTPQAMKDDAVVAERLNQLPKVVFSRTLSQPRWTHTRVVKDDVVSEVRRMKQSAGEDLVILGSGSIVVALAPAGLIDQYDLVVAPVVIGSGRTMFDRNTKPTLRPTKTRVFANGNVLLCYEPANAARQASTVTVVKDHR